MTPVTQQLHFVLSLAEARATHHGLGLRVLNSVLNREVLKLHQMRLVNLINNTPRK